MNGNGAESKKPTMIKITEIKKGQQLYCVFRQGHGNNQFVEVLKVGRKWIELSNHARANKDTLTLDGGKYSSPGQLYLTKEEYQAKIDLDKAWDRLRSFVTINYRCPFHITQQQIEAALLALGVAKTTKDEEQN